MRKWYNQVIYVLLLQRNFPVIVGAGHINVRTSLFESFIETVRSELLSFEFCTGKDLMLISCTVN